MPTGVYQRNKEMQTGKHMTGRIPWNKGKKNPNATGRNYSGTWTREREREYQKEWARNKRASSAEYRQKGSEKSREWQKRNPIQNSWTQCQVNARKREIGFQLNREEYEQMILSDCTYCGEKPNPVNGVDRKDSNIDYILENCVPCCKICNRSKNVLSVEEFTAWVQKVYQHLANKN